MCLIFIKDKPKCLRVMKDTENRLFRSKNTGLYSDALSMYIYIYIYRERERERDLLYGSNNVKYPPENVLEPSL